MAGSAAAARLPGAGFELRYLGSRGEVCRESLPVGWSTRFERVAPVRAFPSYQGQRSFSGSWWSATTGELVGFESWLERDQVMMLDFSPEVVAFSSQQFWLSWLKAGKRRKHAPDYFARLRDGTGVVIDVRADDRIEPADAEVFAVTAEACKMVGWVYRRVGVVVPALAANVRWLAGYRHPRCRDDQYADRLVGSFAGGAPLLAMAREVGDPIAVLPTLFHLLWSGLLVADLEQCALTANTCVMANGVVR